MKKRGITLFADTYDPLKLKNADFSPYRAKGKIITQVTSLSKLKTFLQMVAIAILLTGDIGNKIINFQDYNAQTVGIILLWLSAFLTLYTGYDYLRKGIDHAINEDSKD